MKNKVIKTAIATTIMASCLTQAYAAESLNKSEVRHPYYETATAEQLAEFHGLNTFESKSGNHQPYIVDGGVADPLDNKFFARIIISGDTYYINSCGASILNDRYILTAAHCVDGTGYNVEDLRVVVKNPNLLIRTSEMKLIENIWIHEDYENENSFFVGDIAVLELKYPITDNVESIELPDVTDESVFSVADYDLKLFGLGDTLDIGYQPSEVKQADMKFVEDDSCERIQTWNSGMSDNKDNIICANLHDTSLISGNSCSGDSGGPLTYLKDGKYQQIGVVSYGFISCEAGRDSAFSSLVHYRDWVYSYSFSGNPLSYNPSIDDGNPISEGDTKFVSGDSGVEDSDSGSENTSGDSGGSTGLFTLFGLLLLARFRNK